MAYRLQVFEEGRIALGNVLALRMRGAPVKKAQMPVRPTEKVHARWEKKKLPKELWSKASYFLVRWISGYSWFVAPTDDAVRAGVQQEMWNNPKIWDISADWAKNSPWTGPKYEALL